MAIDFLSLPAEVIHSIFARVEPIDLARLKRCCRSFNSFIKSDRLIFKEVFLNHFDDPRCRRHTTDVVNDEPSWEEDLRQYVEAGRILESKNMDIKAGLASQQKEKSFVAEAIEKLVQTSNPDSQASLSIRFLNEWLQEENTLNKYIFMCSSSLFEWANTDYWEDGCAMPYSSKSARNNDEKFDYGLGPVFDDDTPQGSNSRTSRRSRTNFSEAEVRAQQLSAKIHCLYGVPACMIRRSTGHMDSRRHSLRNDTAPLHPYVRSRVYDLQQHTQHNNGSLWGPFFANSRQEVDWEKVEAIMCMLNINMASFKRTHDLFNEDSIPDWTVPFKGTTPGSYRSRPMSIPMQPPAPLEARDPYNISGTWMRVVCFLDYTELYDFNFGPDSRLPRPPLDTEEATRLITMRIQITDIKPPGPEEGQGLPVVHFKGTSSSVRPSWDADAHSEIREQGIVRLTPQGEVRWTTWSIFHGEERWRSEGIQVGGVQSGRGVLGFWFDKDYDQHGPAGPTAFWKSHDGIEKRQPLSQQLHNGLHALHVPLY